MPKQYEVDEDGLCTYCGRAASGPAAGGECLPTHARAMDWAELVAAEIESEVCGRKGIGWHGCYEEIQAEIRAALANIVRVHCRPR